MENLINPHYFLSYGGLMDDIIGKLRVPLDH